ATAIYALSVHVARASSAGGARRPVRCARRWWVGPTDEVGAVGAAGRAPTVTFRRVSWPHRDRGDWSAPQSWCAPASARRAPPPCATVPRRLPTSWDANGTQSHDPS